MQSAQADAQQSQSENQYGKTWDFHGTSRRLLIVQPYVASPEIVGASFAPQAGGRRRGSTPAGLI
jgi:hypothetical protein